MTWETLDSSSSPSAAMNTLTLMIAPCADLLGPGSRVRLVGTRKNVGPNPLNHYREHNAEWAEMGQMRARTHAEIKAGHYWKVVCIEPAAQSLADDLEHALSPAAFTIELPDIHAATARSPSQPSTARETADTP